MISDLMTDLTERVGSELSEAVEIADVGGVPDVDDMYHDKRTWKRVEDVVVVAADLRGSTKLNFERYANTSASLYEALCSNVVRCYSKFEPAFIDIQGDGFFGLFDGERRYERAICAGITIKTFSEQVLLPQVEEHRDERFPSTGLKVGMASGILVVKRVGIRGTNEPVWAGKPVNWAFKAAQEAQANQLIATERVYKKFAENDYVTHSCDCKDNPAPLWDFRQVSTLPETDAQCRLLETTWCKHCGDLFCEAILAGKTNREAVQNHPR